jgi:serine/threonine-protein kinase
LARNVSVHQPGDVVGHFELLGLLGRGGSGQVWRARAKSHGDFRKTVALKLLNAESQAKASADSLLHEARLGAELRHPNIVDIFEVGLSEGRLHVAMEFVDGGSLEDLIAAAIAQDLEIPPSVVVEVGVGIAKALAWAHTFHNEEGQPRHIIHRDLKPANVLLSRSGVPKVADFGLAKVTGLPHTTTTGLVRGTPSYMAPEIWEGVRTYGPETDLFALGCVLWELTMRSCLFDGETVPQVYGAVAYGDPVQEAGQLGALCPGLVPIVEDLLQREPSARSQDAKAVASALGALRADLSDGINLQDFLKVVRPVVPSTSSGAVESQSAPTTVAEPAESAGGSKAPWVVLGVVVVVGFLGLSSQRTETLNPDASADQHLLADPSPKPASGEEAGDLVSEAEASPDSGVMTPVAAGEDSSPDPVDTSVPVRDERSASSPQRTKVPGRKIVPSSAPVAEVETAASDQAANPDVVPSAGSQTEACLVLSSSPGGAQVWLDSERSSLVARSRPRRGLRRAPGRLEVSMGGRSPQARVNLELRAGEATEVSCAIGSEALCTVKPASFELCD